MVGDILGVKVGFETLGDIEGNIVGVEDVGLTVGFEIVGVIVGSEIVGVIVGLIVGLQV